MRRLPLLALLATLAAPSVASAQHTAQSLADELGDRLSHYVVESDGSVDYGEALAVVDASPDTVMRIVTDYARYQEFVPHFEQSRELSRRGNNALVYMQALAVRETVTLWCQMRIYQRRPRGDTRIIEGRMTEGNMEQFVARWEVTPVDDGARSLVRFRILVHPDLPFPSSVFTGQNRNAARRTLDALRDRATEARFRVAENR